MIIADASALLSIILKEDDAAIFEGALISAGGAVMSPVNYWETLARSSAEFAERGQKAAKDVMTSLNVDVVTLSAADAESAAEAFRRYGKGAGGKLNLGDCFAYALAAREGDGLLYKGDDFPTTDVKSALDRA